MKLSHLLIFVVALWPSYTSAFSGISIKNKLHKYNDYELELDRLLISLHEMTKVPGYSVAVVHKGKTVASVSTGFTDIDEKVNTTEQSIFRLASVSKVIGATMLAELVIQGRLDPDKPIGHYMPQVDRRYHSITVRQLLSHTSGMPHYQVKDYDIYDQHYNSALDAVSSLKSRKLLSIPGSNYHYSTHGYTLAGALYEHVTKKQLSTSLPDFIKRWTGRKTPIIENILGLAPNTSNLYSYSSGKVQNEKFGEKSYSVFGAGLSSTALDLAHFGYAVLHQSKINAAYKSLLFSPSLTNNGGIVTTPKYQVGFGWRIGDDMQGRKVYHHAGATPGARSVLVIYPEEDLSISILSNTSWVSGIDKMAYSLAGLYLDKAKATPFNSKTTYKATFRGSKATGDVSCNRSICFIENENTSFTTWQNTFNSTAEFHDDWPIFLYSSSSGKRLLMVGKTGINTLLDDKGHYQVTIGKNKVYSLQFEF